MSTGLIYKDNKILRIITILILSYAIIVILQQIYKLLSIYFTQLSPLIPKDLFYYASFPAYFVLPIFSTIVFLCIRFLKAKKYNFIIVYFLFGLSFLFFIFQWKIYGFVMNYNPYAS